MAKRIEAVPGPAGDLPAIAEGTAPECKPEDAILRS